MKSNAVILPVLRGESQSLQNFDIFLKFIYLFILSIYPCIPYIYIYIWVTIDPHYIPLCEPVASMIIGFGTSNYQYHAATMLVLVGNAHSEP